jgi:hypothetical protein
MTVQCCKCKRVHQDGCWLAEQPPNDVPVTHSYCPICEDECYIELFCAQASRSTRGHAQAVSQLVDRLIPEM